MNDQYLLYTPLIDAIKGKVKSTKTYILPLMGIT